MGTKKGKDEMTKLFKNGLKTKRDDLDKRLHFKLGVTVNMLGCHEATLINGGGHYDKKENN